MESDNYKKKMIIIGVLTIIIGLLAIIVDINVHEIRNILGLEPNEKGSNKHMSNKQGYKETVIQNHKTWYKRGVAFSKIGLYKEAIEAYNKAIEIKPDYHDAWSNKAFALRKLGRNKEASEADRISSKIRIDEIKRKIEDLNKKVKGLEKKP